MWKVSSSSRQGGGGGGGSSYMLTLTSGREDLFYKEVFLGWFQFTAR